MKGQNLRILIGNSASTKKAVASALDCTFHLTAGTESSRTKDSEGDWDEVDMTTKSWDVSTNALFSASEDGADSGVDLMNLIGEKVYVSFTETNGAKNRSAVNNAITRTGQAIVTDINVSAQVGQKVQYSVQLQGTGPLSAS